MQPPGRKNRFANIRPLSATDERTALSPVIRLSQLERSIFNLTVTRNPHLRPADVVMVTTYARAAARVLKADKFTDDALLEKRTRTMVLLGRSLRLTPQSMTDPKTAGRSRRDAQPSPLDEYFANHPDDDDDDDDANGR
jgi:hypothetical protein